MKIHKAYPRREFNHDTGQFEDAPGFNDHAACGHDIRGGYGNSGRMYSQKNISTNWGEVTCRRCLPK